MERKNIILDTDISNEVDDQFALTYLTKSLDTLNLQAITIAPFERNVYSPVKTMAEGTDLSFNTAAKIFDLLNVPQYKKLLYKGATKYFFESKELNPAARQIIKIATANTRTTVIAIGAITNVALALYHAPQIVDKVDVVWLGGHSFLSDNNTEYNFRQDVEAVRYVFDSQVNLTVIPCKNVASNLSTTIYELEHYLLNNGEIGNYLCEIVRQCSKAYRKQPDDIIGEYKVLWDISAVAYCINTDWFTCKKMSCPEILDDTSYKQSDNRHSVTFVTNLNRHKIFKDFFIKMGCTK